MSTTDNSSPSPQASAFEAAVRGRSWDWLLELRRRLKIDVQLVDVRHVALLAQPSGSVVSGLSALFDAKTETFASVLSEAMQSRAPQYAALNGVQVVCIALTIERRVAGALLVGRPCTPGQDADASRKQLELIASWLSTAAEVHLVSPPAMHASGLDRVAPLMRLLTEAADRTSERELIRLFGEAVVVWHDLEVCGYVETPQGTFLRDVTLPGANDSERPLVIPAAGLPESSDLTRLPQGHLDRFGLPVNSDVYVTRLRRGRGRSWLLVVIGAIDAYDLQRLGAYSAILDATLASASHAVCARAVASISRCLIDSRESHERSAGRALDELRATLSATSATLTIEGKDGAPVFRMISPTQPADGGDYTRTARLVSVRRIERQCATTLTLARSDGLQFTPRDHDVADSVAAIFEWWSRAALRGEPAGSDRRSRSWRFHEILERSAKESLARGSAVTAVALLARDAAHVPGLTQRWVAGMRGQMRASDLAGMLAEGEIGLLLHDASSDDARRVGERLRSVVRGEQGAGAIHIGFASRAPGLGTGEGIVQAARADALRHGNGGSGKRQQAEVES